MVETELEILKDRLAAWELEKETNRYGMQEVADRAIKILTIEIERKQGEVKNEQRHETH